MRSPQLVPIKKKTERRESIREAKALSAARLEKSLERELIARLKSRAYGDQPLNVNEDVWQAVLNREREVDAQKELEELGMESDEETDEEEEEGEYEEQDEDEMAEFVSDFDESDVEDMEEYDGAEVRLVLLSFALFRSPTHTKSVRTVRLRLRRLRRRRIGRGRRGLRRRGARRVRPSCERQTESRRRSAGREGQEGCPGTEEAETKCVLSLSPRFGDAAC